VISGYQRADGGIGIRNLVLCIHTVECSSFVAQQIGALDPRIHVMGFSGCYRNEYAARMLMALGTHPNVGAALLVSLGCEGTDAEAIASTIRQSGRPVGVVRIQDAGGTADSIATGRECAARSLAEIEKAPRVPMTWADLVIGTECGGSDATSGISANPAVGRAFDRIVDAGGTAIIEETLEMVGCADIVANRGRNPEAAAELRAAVEKAEQFSMQIDQFSIAPGNHDGGLTTIEEKSMGAFAKCGSRLIEGVIKVAQKAPRPGLWVLDSVPDPSSFLFGYSNPNDSEGILDLISCGAHMVLFTTGRGSVIGSVISPVVKVCGNPKTFARMSGDMDINAGRVITGEAGVDEVGRAAFELLEEIAGGRPSMAERLGHREYFVPYKSQDFCIHP
jgi:altronate dehydratase large subunit